MVLKPEPVFAAVESLGAGDRRTLLLSPAGRRLDQDLVRELAAEPWLVLICGRYEGVDERVVEGCRPRRSRSATSSSRAGRSRRWWCSRR
jgi:tRNA-(guanine-N1)-methyltransferase